MRRRPSGPRTVAVVGAIVATASSLIVAPQIASALPVTVFTDGFESGSMSAWSRVQGVTVRNTDRHSGTFSARATSTGTAAYAQHTLPASTADVTIDTWLKLVSISTEASVLVARTASGPLFTLALAKTGRLLTRNAVSGASVTSTTAPTAGVWHELKLHAAIGSAGLVEVWLDGTKIAALSKTQNLGTARITSIQIGGTDKNRKYDLSFDDVTVTTPDTTAPTVPTGVTATATAPRQVTVAWNASTDDLGVTSYAIVRDGNQIGTVNGTTLTYVDTGLASAHTYGYSVFAIDGSGNRSAASSVATATTPDSQAPTAPQGVSAGRTGSLQIRVTWSASSDDVGVTSYAVVRDGTQVSTVSGTTLTYVDGGLAPGDHTYTVAALDAAGNRSAPSAPASATAADTQPPETPTLVSATPVAFDTVDLKWSAVTDDAGVAGYGVYRAGVLVATVDGSSTTYEDTGLAGSSTYTYTVDAFDAAGNRSGLSGSLDATTPAAPDHDPPSAPRNLAATATDPHAVDLEWSQSFDNIGVTSYRVLRDGTVIATIPADPNPFADQTYHDGSVSPNTSYTYRVVALDAAGNVSDPSGAAAVTTPNEPDTQPPTPPGSLQASAAVPTEVDLTWTAANDDRVLAGYNVVRDGQLIAQLAADATSYADVGTEPATRYGYAVQAVDAAGNVSTPATVSVTTPALPCNAPGGELPPTASDTYRAFSPGSIWNAPIRSAAVDCNSDAMMAWLRSDSASNYIRLAGSTSGGTWGNPIYWSTDNDPAFAVTNSCTVDQPPEFQAIRIPLDAQPDDSTDAAMTVYDLTSGVVVAFHHTVKTVASDGSVSWSACGGAAYHLDSNGLAGGAAGADDARNMGHRGVPPPTYAVRWDEIQAGSIDHALKIAINNTCDHVWPLVGDEGCSTGGLIPEGTRIRIRPGIDLSTYGLSPAALTIATALQRYGAYVGDQSGGGVALKVENTVAEGRGNLWNGVLDPKSLSAIPLSAYEVVGRGWGSP